MPEYPGVVAVIDAASGRVIRIASAGKNARWHAIEQLECVRRGVQFLGPLRVRWWTQPPLWSWPNLAAAAELAVRILEPAHPLTQRSASAIRRVPPAILEELERIVRGEPSGECVVEPFSCSDVAR